MLSTFDTDRVARAFSRNRATYDRHAIVQRAMARDLTQRLRDHCPARLERVLELGCGTGLITRELADAFDLGAYVVNDLVPEFARDGAAYLVGRGVCPVSCLHGDIARIEDYPGAQSLIVSGATFQWLREIEPVIARLLDALERGGVLAFTTFGPDNCAEIRALTGLGLPYPTLPELRASLKERAEILVARESRQTLYFDSALEVLRHLRYTGVNGVADWRWSPRELREFCANYEAVNRCEKGVALTYHPVLVVARKVDGSL